MKKFKDEKANKSFLKKMKRLVENMTSLVPLSEEEIKEMNDQLTDLEEKEKLGTITKAERKMLAGLKKKIDDTVFQLSVAALMASEEVKEDRNALFQILKEQAETGDKEAQRIYEMWLQKEGEMRNKDICLN